MGARRGAQPSCLLVLAGLLLLLLAGWQRPGALLL